jgi:hypothetical protein
MVEIHDIVGTDKYHPDIYDGYITSQGLLPRGDESRLGTVLRRRTDENVKPLGRSNEKPIMDTKIYEGGFADGVILE